MIQAVRILNITLCFRFNLNIISSYQLNYNKYENQVEVSLTDT